MDRNAHAGRQKKHFWLQCGAYGGVRDLDLNVG